MQRDLDKCVQFLNEAGLVTSHENGASGFVKGVRIKEGKLLVDFNNCKVAYFGAFRTAISG